MTTSACSSPLATPEQSPCSSPRASLVPVLTPKMAFVMGSTLECFRSRFARAGWLALFLNKPLSPKSSPKKADVPAPATPAPAKKSPKKAPASPKPAEEVHECQAVAWYDPALATWEPHDDPNLPLDRRRCGKKAISSLDIDGEVVWCCGTHAKTTPEACSTCAKNKHVDFEGSHKHALCKRGFITTTKEGKLVYTEGKCEGLLREGASKLAKKGHERWAK